MILIECNQSATSLLLETYRYSITRDARTTTRRKTQESFHSLKMATPAAFQICFRHSVYVLAGFGSSINTKQKDSYFVEHKVRLHVASLSSIFFNSLRSLALLDLHAATRPLFKPRPSLPRPLKYTMLRVQGVQHPLA